MTFASGKSPAASAKILLCTVCAVFCAAMLRGGDISDLQGLTMKEIKFPVYRGDKLQLFIYGGKAVKNGQLVAVEFPVLDIIRRGADVDDVKFDGRMRAYPLDAKLPELLDFWRRKLYCDGTVFSDTAEVNYQTREVVGKDEIRLRTPVLDMNGTGFRAEYEKRRMEVFRNIQFILRLNSCDPVKLIRSGTMPDKYSFLRGRGEKLFIDFDAGTITLTGKVSIVEDKNVLLCDKITVYLDRGDDKEKKRAASAEADGKKEDDDIPDSDDYASGIREIVCSGNVILDRKGGGTLQQGRADKLIYSFVDNVIRMRSEKENPRIVNGEDSLSAREIDLDRISRKMYLRKDCQLVISSATAGNGDGKLPPSRVSSDTAEFDLNAGRGVFQGHVKVDDSRMKVECGKLTVNTSSKDAAQNRTSAVKQGEISGLAEVGDFSAAPRELRDITCTGKVKITRKNPAGTSYGDHYAEAEKATLDYPNGVAILSGGRPAVHYDGNSISGKELHVFINEERLSVPEDSLVSLANSGALPIGAKAAAENIPPVSTISSRSSDLDYRKNLLSFLGSVKVRDPRLKLDCDKAEIFLKQRDGGAKKDGAPAASAPASLVSADEKALTSDKTVDKVVCTGKVHAWENRAELFGDRLTMFFRTPGKGEKLSENAFASHGTELESIEVDDHVKLVSAEEKGAEKGAAEKKSSAPVDPREGLASAAGKLFGGANGASTLLADKAELYLTKNEAHFHRNVKMFDKIHTLDAGNLYVYAAGTAVPGKGAASARDNIDADPFAGDVEVPGAVELGPQRSLKRIVADTDVRFERRTEEGSVQRASGDKAVYEVADKVLTVTGTPEKPPFLEETGKGRSTGERIVYYPDRGEMTTDGGTKIEFDPKLFQ